MIAFFCDFAYIKINLIGQLCRGFAAGGAGGFCDCVVVGRGVVWCGVV